jgi:hypothetical protein
MGEENKTYEIVVSGVTKRFEKKEGSFLALGIKCPEWFIHK